MHMIGASQSDRDSEPEPGARPTISIYQNPDHVSGILQQLYFSPLIVDESHEQGTQDSSSEKADDKTHAGAKADVKVPGIGGFGFDVSGDQGGSRDYAMRADSKQKQSFTYSQAYYLLAVREALRSRGSIKVIRGSQDASSITSGDFVEFQASFQPSSLHSLLDILTPEFIAAFTEHYVKNEGFKTFPDNWTLDEAKKHRELLDARAEMRSDIARATAQAVREDFRAEKTREFYGTVGDVTAITICDNVHFTVEDEDRILDGSFSVLGKATSAIEYDLPILSRNKLLDRLSPELVDSVFKRVRESATEQAFKLEQSDGEEDEIENAFDLALPSRIAGPSFKVIPIAIYV